jgi:CheY-like chemotaxis protein
MSMILLVDDDDQFRKMLGAMLRRDGHDVVEASDGKEGLRLYKENQVDIVVTDIVMPEKEGIELIIELRKEFPDVKIIAISGGGRIGPKGYLHLAESLGAVCVFEKPIERDEFLRAVNELSVED